VDISYVFRDIQKTRRYTIYKIIFNDLSYDEAGVDLFTKVHDILDAESTLYIRAKNDMLYSIS